MAAMVREVDWQLYNAAARGDVAGISLALLAAGAHVDCADSGGRTPLMRAAMNGYDAAVEALLAAGADVHRVNFRGTTALHWACSWGRVNCVRALLEAGARADVRNRDGKRPIDVVRDLCAVLSCVVVDWLRVTARIPIACRCAHGQEISPPPQPSPHC